jgi:CRISPR/Cas system-associated exonuclease Cas4 (RecB family)
VSTIPDLGLAQSVDSYLWGLNRKPSGRSTHCIHPSEFSISPCDKRIAYGLKGEKQKSSISASLRRIFDMGHACHEILQDALEEACPDFEPEVRVQWPSIKLSGSCDGVLGDTGYEIKSISDSGFQKLSGAKSEHRKQGTLYGVPLSLSQMNYMYVNKNTGEIAEYPVVIDKQLWHSMASRAEKIIKTVDEGEMPPETDKTYLCKQCPYCWTCKPSLWRSYE